LSMVGRSQSPRVVYSECKSAGCAELIVTKFYVIDGELTGWLFDKLTGPANANRDSHSANSVPRAATESLWLTDDQRQQLH
jgi:hypothetical protein